MTASGPTKVLTAQGSVGQKVGETWEEVTAQQQRMQVRCHPKIKI